MSFTLHRLVVCLRLMAERLRSPKDRDDDRHDHNEERRHILHLLKEIMIAQSTLDASIKNLTVAVDAAVAALATGSTATSTPDTVVSAFQAGVDAQTVRIATATPPPTPATPAAAKSP